MLRPNLAMDAPPVSLAIGGAERPIETDFRVWIEVTALMKRFKPVMRGDDDRLHNAQVMLRIEELVFGGRIDADFAEVLAALTAFAAGYPQPSEASAAEDGGAPVCAFEWDINAIVIAIRNQSGIDLSYERREPFHWWRFLEEFRNLCGDHAILRLMQLRGYAGSDPLLRRAARRYALPADGDAAQRVLEAFENVTE